MARIGGGHTSSPFMLPSMRHVLRGASLNPHMFQCRSVAGRAVVVLVLPSRSPLFSSLSSLPPPAAPFSSSSYRRRFSSKPSVPPPLPLASPLAHARWSNPLSSSSSSQSPESNDLKQNVLNAVEAESAASSTRKFVRIALVGNLCITVAKLAAWMSSGSSAMLAEAIHSIVDSGNQALLLVGLRDVGRINDKAHPYGYGKSIYFWSLVSALGTFWLGAGVSMTHCVGELMHPTLHEVTWHVWSVLGFSLVVDGWVFYKVVSDLYSSKPADVSFYRHVRAIRDPATLAVLLEDGAACTGVLMATCGLGLSAAFGTPFFDGIAGVGVSCLLGGMGLVLARLNQRYLLGQAVDDHIVADINKILTSRQSIDNVHSVQSQWTGPYSFSYKAEVDFDGTYLAAKLMKRYQGEFLKPEGGGALTEQDLKVLLSWYAEDVMRTVETEVREIEAEVREQYPMAAYIELEPDSKDSNVFAIDQGKEVKLRRDEITKLNKMLLSIIEEEKEESKLGSAGGLGSRGEGTKFDPTGKL